MRIHVAAFALLSLAACGGGSPTEGGKETPIDYSRVSLTIVSGNGQTDTVTRELDQPLAVEVKTEDGRPVPGIAVNFVVPQPEECGAPFAGSAVTTANGRAMERWTLGRKARECTMEVRAVNPETGAAIVFKAFTATALADTFASVNNGGGEGGFPYVAAFQFADQYGNAIPSYRLVAPAGAPVQVMGATEGTVEAKTVVRVDSAAWAATRPFGSYSYSGGVNPYTNRGVQLRLFINGRQHVRVVCAMQGRNSPAGRYDQMHPGRVNLHLAPLFADPQPADPCEFGA
ncbi:MAG TPA: hypothetical protein VFT45_12845 [Longimicrobium sp.]|nr:hypothetical protein [Longimicrobium sp.]